MDRLPVFGIDVAMYRFSGSKHRGSGRDREHLSKSSTQGLNRGVY